ncbi:DnaJ-domain-containing protein [Fragilariopsis cylindrus CCMP1102]|uniref:DnaJ-domain-containing protein n=1 Tax=Fragilariopsis cylindrus CCMP1102 TaxID=635003 RepID=A0A1E7ELG8_9STRA|nr:DnaJ-domain-containing protein [Fragilariopsis cylindrus CCMP1102]|eukprot:OEU06403.1 DnaJ-domain-containing protein [Fragilariopsis cylindrus CCMP1102]
MVQHQHIDDPYIVLNLVNRDTSTQDEIKQSYRQLAKKYHPDTWSASCFSEDEKQHATTKFQQISSANTLLTDPIQKLNYDRNYKLGLYDNNDNNDSNDNGSSGNGNGNGRSNNRSTTDRRQSSSNNSNNNNFQRQQEQNSCHQYTQQTHEQSHQQSQSQQSQQSHQQSQIPKRPMGIPPPLPKGWTTIKDPISGNLYYYHTRSQRSTWNHPALCSNTSSYNNTNNTAPHAQQTRTSSGNTNYNFGGGNRGQQQQKNHPPTKKKMFGGDFPFNRRPYNNDRYNANNNAYYNNMDNDENINAGGRKVIVDNEPDTHRCGSFLVLILCPPIGILAMYHSIMVTRCWEKSQEQDFSNNVEEEEENNEDKNDGYENSRQRQEELAQGHSSRAGLYACFGNTLGIVFWIYYLFIRGGDESIFEFPKEWNIDEWFDDK